MLTHTTLTRSVAALAALVLVASACGSDATPAAAPATATATTMDPEMDMEMDADDGADDDHAAGFSFGEPADAADATRVIEIVTNDDFTFDPAELTVEAGETVTFRVENVGFLDHDFTLGDEDTQIDHEAEMAEMAVEGGAMMDMPDEANAFSLAAGETKELTWHFTDAGDILYGCHIPGHYAAGMKGAISIQG